MNFIVSYTLKNDEIPDTFLDRYIVLKHEEGFTFESAILKYDEILLNDGNEEGWHIWTINLSVIAKSTDN